MLKQKYMLPGDETWPRVAMRVASAVFPKASYNFQWYVAKVIQRGLFMPGGRILAGAGSKSNVTLFNCFLSGKIEDHLSDIMQKLHEAAITQSMGGGIGYDFTPLRPEGAYIQRLGEGTGAAGPIPFMRIFDASCRALESYGNRRGAQMGVLADHHPDIFKFIEAKQKKGELTNFNISVAISNEFMLCVKRDDYWTLWHWAPKHKDQQGITSGKFNYKVVPARKLWDAIMKSTYHYSEPGVIFIDRVNQNNPLKNYEQIYATNPCGEQALPPYGTCNLGHINLARLVEQPLTRKAKLNTEVLVAVARLGTAFLDAVIDISKYPLPEQEKEAKLKRRIGLGIPGLANCLDFLGLKYDSDEGRKLSLIHI